jgi:hypothetical protein
LEVGFAVGTFVGTGVGRRVGTGDGLLVGLWVGRYRGSGDDLAGATSTNKGKAATPHMFLPCSGLKGLKAQLDGLLRRNKVVRV